jgi:hypothetical protein
LSDRDREGPTPEESRPFACPPTASPKAHVPPYGFLTRSELQGSDQSGTAAKYSSRATLRRCVECPSAPLACSTHVGDSLARGSGRRGRRFKSMSPRLYSRRSEALTRVGEGLSCCQYSSKIRQVQQRRRELTCASKALPQPALRFARRHRHKRSHRSPTSSTRLRGAGSA